jgi:hypothetical protein
MCVCVCVCVCEHKDPTFKMTMLALSYVLPLQCNTTFPGTFLLHIVCDGVCFICSKPKLLYFVSIRDNAVPDGLCVPPRTFALKSKHFQFANRCNGPESVTRLPRGSDKGR